MQQLISTLYKTFLISFVPSLEIRVVMIDIGSTKGPTLKSDVSWKLWQYGLWSFQTEVTKSARFLPKNQHTQSKLFGQKVPKLDQFFFFNLLKWF